MKKMPHGAIFVVWCEDRNNTHNCAIQPSGIPRSWHLPCNKTHMKAISSIFIYGVTCNLVQWRHPQTQLHAHSVVIPINDYGVTTTQPVQLTTVTIIAGQVTNKNNSIHGKQFCCVLVRWWGMWVWRLFFITLQPAGDTGSYTYGCVARNMEKYSMSSSWT